MNAATGKAAFSLEALLRTAERRNEPSNAAFDSALEMVLKMRVSLYLYSASVKNSIRFYVDELSMFAVVEDFGTGYCLLRANDSPSFHIYLTDWVARPSDQFTFSLDVSNCDAAYRRLREVVFASGARIVPDANGNLEVFEYLVARILKWQTRTETAS